MMLRRLRLACSLLLLSFIGCDADRPLAPDVRNAVASSGNRTVLAPSNLTATAVSSSHVDVAWQDNSDNESGFEIYVSVTGVGTFNLWTTTGPNVTKQSFTGIAAEREYCAKARAITARGKSRTYSEFSNTSCASTALPPSAPLRTDATPLSSSAIVVGWVDNSNNEEGFRVERSLDLGSTWTAVETTSPHVTNIRQGGLASEQQLCYRVIAFNGHGDSPPSIDCTVLPAPPTGLTATGVALPAIDLAWTDASATEDGYEVLRSSDGFTFGVTASLPPNSASYRDVAVNINTRYWYVVRAQKDNGWSDRSDAASAVAATTLPNAPSSADAIPAGSSAVSLYWINNANNQDGFRVERSADGGVTWDVAGKTPWNGFTDQGRAAEQQVCYRVLAYNGVGESGWSNTDCTIPPAGPTGLVATPIGADSVEYAWIDNSGVEEAYVVELYIYDPSACGEYYEYCDPYYYAAVELPPNTTSYRLGPNDYFSGVAARKDGGYSDWLTPY